MSTSLHPPPTLYADLNTHPRKQRGKSENKFYAAMRDKEAIETERKNLSRNLEKQAKVMEKLQESEKSFAVQVVSSPIIGAMYIYDSRALGCFYDFTSC